jgi:hypothetical protein
MASAWGASNGGSSIYISTGQSAADVTATAVNEAAIAVARLTLGAGAAYDTFAEIQTELQNAVVLRSGLVANLSAAGHRLTGLGQPVDNTDACRLTELNAVSTVLSSKADSASVNSALAGKASIDGVLARVETRLIEAQATASSVSATGLQIVTRGNGSDIDLLSEARISLSATFIDASSTPITHGKLVLQGATPDLSISGGGGQFFGVGKISSQVDGPGATPAKTLWIGNEGPTAATVDLVSTGDLRLTAANSMILNSTSNLTFGSLGASLVSGTDGVFIAGGGVTSVWCEPAGYAGYRVPFIDALRTATQLIPHNTPTAVTWGGLTQRYIFTEPYVGSGGGHLFVIPTTGLYNIQYSVLWATTGSSASQYSKEAFIQTPTGFYGYSSLADGWKHSYSSGSATVAFQAGDVFSLYVTQINWGTENTYSIIGSPLISGGTHLTATYVGSLAPPASGSL